MARNKNAKRIIDPADPLGKRVAVLVDEHQYRYRILQQANHAGGKELVKLVKMLFEKYDKILATVQNDQEHEAIATMAITELQRLIEDKGLGHGGNISVNNKIVIQ